jgi:hypothetical protein
MQLVFGRATTATFTVAAQTKRHSLRGSSKQPMVQHSVSFLARVPTPATRLVSCMAAAAPSFVEATAQPVVSSDGSRASLPAVAGVYAVYDPAGTLQYIGISRKIAVSMATHMEALPELVGSVKVLEMPEASKEELTEAWRAWVQEAGVCLYVFGSENFRCCVPWMRFYRRLNLL